MKKISDKPEKCRNIKKMSFSLRNLKSLIIHAREVEKDTEAIVRSLQERYVEPRTYTINTNLDINVTHIKEIFADCSDFRLREITINPLKRRAAVCFFEGMVDNAAINKHIIEKLTVPPVSGIPISLPENEAVAYLKDILLTTSGVEETTDMDKAVQQMLSGETVVFIDGSDSILIATTRRLESRAISEPPTESDVRGPRDGFTEDIRINITLLRRRLKNPNVVVKNYVVGVRSKTDISVMYFRGIVNPKLVYEVERRIKGINVDLPNGANSLQSMIETHPYSPFPTTLATERPDKVAAALVEGKVGIFLDGTPFCLIVPATIVDFFQAGDDYYEKWISSCLIRITRYAAALFSLIMPAVYVAMTNFHPGLIPTPLALNIAISRLGIPFPALVEALFMNVLLEILLEAGLRLPKNVGPTVSIVGGLVIGEAAVRAGLVSPGMVIITAFTAIASFNVPNYSFLLVLRLLRVPIMFLAASFGMFGLAMGLLGIIIHLSMLESMGKPYLAPLIPRNIEYLSDLKDTIMMVPSPLMRKRPAYLEPEDSERQEHT